MKRFFLLFLTPIILLGCNQIAKNKASSMYLDGKLIVDNEEYNLILGYYAYKDDKVEINKLDPFSPMEAADEFETLAVAKNSKIEITLEDQSANITLRQWSENGEIEEILLDGNLLTVPAEEGYYVYEVVGKWRNGETTLVFDIDVK
ncbi:hypothetical protein JSQ81_08790 [Sporosarcina sp. Marseille-Q4063]|uniref:hypothetical protein n=1 Tax=Sporosarcina sp. Marseille-Q4063 TaxID=2810514 RepID=UPI001BB0C2E6|nr:hypothetical protein [Sporosarcina sp. Marseille-Q4063]QUW23581.1 hypothetical protein JSQ81_08790 [Sporosarcina sp. Marseille-Q4063]